MTIPVSAWHYDSDGDAIPDSSDACPFDYYNDADGVGVCGNVDNFPNIYNPYPQTNSDGDVIGDACDTKGSEISVGPSVLNFGNVNLGSCSNANFAIQHVLGTEPTTGTVTISLNPPFSITSGPP